MQSSILLIGPRQSSLALIQELNRKLNLSSKHVTGHGAGIKCLRQSEFSVILIDESIVRNHPVASNLLFRHAGSAPILEISFRKSDFPRVLRQVRTAINRSAHYEWRVNAKVRERLALELDSCVSTLLAESKDVLRSAKPEQVPKLRRLVQAAGQIREQLGVIQY